MRKLALFAMTTLLLCSVVLAQNSNTVTVQVVAPASWTITVSPSNYAQNTAKAMTITVTAGPVSNTCTATWDSTPLPLVFPASLTNPVALTANVTAAMTATVGAHSIFITCPQPVLSQMQMNAPVQLPNAPMAIPYSASLLVATGVSGGTPPYSWTCSGLPIGLSCTSSGMVIGTPSSRGSFTFGFTAIDSSGLALLRLLPRFVAGGA